MGITMSPQDYATAFRLLSLTSRHHENIGRELEARILPRLPVRPSLLDVGAGQGKVAERLAPHFGSLTLLEPHREQIGALALERTKIVHDTLESYASTERYDLVLCSHVLYHVPLAHWGGFIDRLLAFTGPGGYCVLALGAARGQNYRLHRDFTETVTSSAQLIETLREKRIAHEAVPVMNGFSAASFDEMYALCRFFVLEDCFTAAQLGALSQDEARELEDKIRLHAERRRGADGVYRLEQEEDLILIPKP